MSAQPAICEVRPGQVWIDEERGHIHVLAVADGYAMLRRRRRNPFIVSLGQMQAGQYGWRLLHDAPASGTYVEAVLEVVAKHVGKTSAMYRYIRHDLKMRSAKA